VFVLRWNKHVGFRLYLLGINFSFSSTRQHRQIEVYVFCRSAVFRVHLLCIGTLDWKWYKHHANICLCIRIRPQTAILVWKLNWNKFPSWCSVGKPIQWSGCKEFLRLVFLPLDHKDVDFHPPSIFFVSSSDVIPLRSDINKQHTGLLSRNTLLQKETNWNILLLINLYCSAFRIKPSHPTHFSVKQ
jgi:hypothetical protein